MIAIPRPPERRKRPDPPWLIDAHASIFLLISPTSGQSFLHPSAVQLPRPDPFATDASDAAFGPPGLGTEPASELKYVMHVNLDIGNPNRFPVVFETMVIRFDRGTMPRNFSDAVEQTTIFTDDGKIISNFSYKPVNFRKSPSKEKPRQFQVESRTAIGLTAFALGGDREIEKQYAPRFILQLFHKEVAVSRPIVASIPYETPIPVRDPLEHGVAPFQGLPVSFSQY